MSSDLPVRPPTDVWVPLAEALTWMRCSQGEGTDELLPETRERLGMTAQELPDWLQDAWRELADEASLGGIAIRARADGAPQERALRPDDLRNCRFVALDAQRGIAIGLRIERHEDTFHGAWRRMGDDEGSDYSDVVVSRKDLLKRYPAPAPSIAKLKSSVASANAALAWLKDELERLEPKAVPKAELLDEMRHRFSINKTRARAIWTQAVQDHPEWSLPGPRSRKRSNHRIESK